MTKLTRLHALRTLMCGTVAAVTLTFTLTACTAPPSVATLANNPKASQPAAADAGDAYVKCAKEHGIDVSFNAAGEVQFPAQRPAGFNEMLSACSKFVPQSMIASSELSQDQIATLLTFAKCMREHGVTDFPDPGPKGFTDDQMKSLPKGEALPADVLKACNGGTVSNGLG
ncbi:MAG TPA: hypothetical protein VFU07_10175 [Candidatus Lumbricidophila sp.]|nr:hypothetical protein [Candidatus Lumbricidophila sp.]